jgi:class 3 adenylate cyclase/tetratricopeptide (TPR) repeat protein
MVVDAIFCAGCSVALPSKANFCPNCGCKVDVEAASGAEQKVSGPEQMLASTGRGERRQITVMFCDLVDSTALSDRLDPEDERETLRHYHAHAETVVESFGGLVAQYRGDGVQVYFGALQANEDDAERAILAALAILDGMPQVNERLAQSIPELVSDPIRVRIGVHTGPVVVDGAHVGDRQDRLAWGVTINVTSRLEAVAPAGTCVISSATHKLVEGLFELESLGLKELKGLDRPIEVYRVLSPISSHLRRNDTAVHRVQAFIGRRDELDHLLSHWAEAIRGRGYALRITGEPGMGKSRLMESLKAELQEPYGWVDMHCSPNHSVSPFFPVVEAIRHALKFRAGDSAETQLGALNRAIAHQAVSVDDQETRNLIAALLGIPLPEGSPTMAGDSELLRKKTMRALCEWIQTVSLQRPLVLLVEDIQWIDASTQELLETLVDNIAQTRILVIITHRSDYTPAASCWTSLPELRLTALSPADIAAIVRDVRGAEQLSESVMQGIVARSDGVPLYAEEFTRSVLEAGSHIEDTDVEAHIPATLQDSLTARLDRLGDAKEVVQQAAVLGRRFRLDHLAALSSIGSDALSNSLEKLVEAQLLQPLEGAEHESFFFRHALIQQVAYDALLRRQRSELHTRIVRILEEQFPAVLQLTPEVAARHCESGGLHEAALGYWRNAADLARMRMAQTEEIDHLRRAISILLEHIPEGSERDEQELELRLALVVQLLSSSGIASTEVEQQSMWARKLCEKLDSPDKLFIALLGRALVDLGRGRSRAALQLSRELVNIASRIGSADVKAQAALPLGGALGMLGDPAAALEELESGIAAAQEAAGQGVDRDIVDGVLITCMTWAADNLWLIGMPDRALAVSEQALAASLSSDIPPPIRAQGLVGASTIAVLRGESEQAAEYADQLIAISEQHDLPFGIAHATISSGWAQTRRGRAHEGICAMQNGLDRLAEVGTGMKRSFYLCLLAEASLEAGMLDTCEAALGEASDYAREYEEVFYLAEILRLSSELARAHGHEEEARRLCDQAFETAARQGAVMLQQRVASFSVLAAHPSVSP